MLCRLLVIALPLIAVSMAGAEPLQASVTLVSYNIHIGVPMGKQIGADVSVADDLDNIWTAISQTRADFVALQEVDCEYGLGIPDRRRSSMINQARYLASKGNYYYVFGSAQDDTGYPTDNPGYVEWGTADQWTNNGNEHGEVGNALLSRWPFTAPPENIPLPKDAGQERRACIRAEIDIPAADVGTSVPVVVYATHLQHNSGETRFKQVKAILDRAQAEPEGRLVFILGDLNHEFHATEEMNPIRLALENGFHDLTAAGMDEDAATSASATYPADEPAVRIDFILSNRPLAVLDKRVINSRASDHLPVAVTVQIAGN